MNSQAAALRMDAFDKNRGFATHGEVEEKQPASRATGAAGEIVPPDCNDRSRSYAPALARLRWWRRPYCQGPCTLGPSFAGLCARCVRGRNRG